MKKTSINELLIKNIKLINDSLINFKLSIEKCKKIDLTMELSFEEQESFDSLTSKFARISDIYTQKILKSICIVYRENCTTFIDRCNFAEKIGIISDVQLLFDIRDLRNEISHEYIDDLILEIYQKTLELSDILIPIIEDTNSHIENNNIFKIS